MTPTFKFLGLPESQAKIEKSNNRGPCVAFIAILGSYRQSWATVMGADPRAGHVQAAPLQR
eukprot:8436141-Ditylum_brightwellii.AAC.1